MAFRADVHKFGRNDDVDSASIPEEIWSVGGLYPFSTGDQVTTILSSTAGDSTTGPGAATCKIFGLSSWQPINEVVTLAGTCEVTLANNYGRINRVACLSAGGTGIQNAGDIDVMHSTEIVARVPALSGQTQQAVYTVPEGGKGYGFIKAWRAQVLRSAAGANAEINICTRNNSTDYIPSIWRVRDNDTATDSLSAGVEFVIGKGIKLSARDDVMLEIVNVGQNNTIISGNFHVQLT